MPTLPMASRSVSRTEGAAARLLSLSPETSDRAVVEVCGLSPTTVGSLRSEHIADEGAGVRKGRDGWFRKIRGKSSPDEGQALSVTSEALDTARVLGPSRRLGRGRLPVAAEDIEDGHMRETGRETSPDRCRVPRQSSAGGVCRLV